MRRRPPRGGCGPLVGLAVALVALQAAGAWAQAETSHSVVPGGPWPELAAGDVVVLAPGRHEGPRTIDVPNVTLLGHGAVLDGGGVGDALTLRAAGVRIEGLTIEGVGDRADLYAPDAALALFGCHGCVIDGLRAEGVTTGVRLEASEDVRLIELDLEGDGRSPGVTAYETPGLRIDGGRFIGFLDGVYLERADGAVVAGALVSGSVRYGLHVMFSVGATLSNNRVVDGGVGSAVMYGRGSRVVTNRFEGHRGAMAFGLLLQQEGGAHVEANTFGHNALGALVVDTPGLALEGNRFEANGVGLLVQRAGTPTEETTSMTVSGNVFSANAADLAVDDEEAALVLRGNAFDRAPPLDLDDDGVLDLPFVATSAFAGRAARQPDLTLLAHGPGVALWTRLEASVPGLRGAAFADPAARRFEPIPRPPGSGTAAAVLAVVLAGLGVALGLGGARRRTGSRS
jgi:nitrous oxidase accessory protein